MKKVLLIVLAVVLNVSVFAQDFPGYEFAEEGTIYLNDTDSVQGVLAFTYFKSNQVMLVGKDQIKYKPDDIKGFYLKTSGLHFVPGEGGLGSRAFHQVISSGKKSKIVKTFTAAKGVKIEAGKEPEGSWSTTFYLVDKKANYTLSKKIAEAIESDCPQLAARLTKKDSGYFVNLLTLDEEMMSAYNKIMVDLDAECN